MGGIWVPTIAGRFDLEEIIWILKGFGDNCACAFKAIEVNEQKADETRLLLTTCYFYLYFDDRI